MILYDSKMRHLCASKLAPAKHLKADGGLECSIPNHMPDHAHKFFQSDREGGALQETVIVVSLLTHCVSITPSKWPRCTQ
jgi:hypothetical protein